MSSEKEIEKILSLEEEQMISPPSMYAVIMKNDDFTPMDFVIMVLEEIFKLPSEQAYALTMEVHNSGKGVAGIYTREIAETKVEICHRVAQRYGHPFRCDVVKA